MSGSGLSLLMVAIRIIDQFLPIPMEVYTAGGSPFEYCREFGPNPTDHLS
jgi:hypothetical protein